MGLKDKLKKYNEKLAKNPFHPIDLTEENVQTYFDKCLATNDTPKEDISRSILFSRTLGYKIEDEFVFLFDKNKLLVNKKSINYLFGQLKSFHNKKEEMSIEEAFYDHSGKKWTNHKAYVLELLCLGCTHETLLLSPFNAETNSAVISSDIIPSTISPKDPNFPQWWEEHKAEWEDRK